LVNFAGLIPVVPISLLAGVLSDRFPRRKLIISTEIILTAQALVMAGLIYFNLIEVWHVIVLSFILGAASVLEQPARLAFVADIVGKEDLSNAIALNSAAYNSARIIGPAIAGMLIAPLGEAACFFVNSVSYLAVIAALLVIKVPRQSPMTGQARVVGSLVDGLKHIKNHPVIPGLLLIISISSFLTIPYITLMPVFARDLLNQGAEGLGFLLTAVGVGAILGGILVASLKTGNRGRWLTISNILGPLFLIVFCFSRNFIMSLVLVAIIGASNAIRQTLANSLTQINTENQYQGRVMSIFNLLFNGMSRVGALVIGGLAEVVSAPIALGGSAFLSVIAGFIIISRFTHVDQLE
jgi:MFS family permease